MAFKNPFGGSDSTLQRLMISSHKKVDCTDSGDEGYSTFLVQLNPENVEYSFGLKPPPGSEGSEPSMNASPGSSGGPQPAFNGFNEMSMDFKFYADATGIVPIDDKHKAEFFVKGSTTTPSIREHLNLLQNTVYGFNPEIHGPPYLKLVWGNVFPSTSNENTPDQPAVFKGILDKCTVKILLFSLQGEPIKAEINLKIKSLIAPEARPMQNSPDITHHIDIGHGDKMTMHCNEIYGRYDSKICSAVAEYNGLIDWNLKPQAKMVFPSIHLLNDQYLNDYEEVEVKPVNEEPETQQMEELIGSKKSKQYYKSFPFKSGEA